VPRIVKRCRAAATIGGWCRTLIMAAGLAWLPVFAVVAPPAAAQQAKAALEPLSIVTASGTHTFSVEVMRSERERERGLMFRHYLPPNRGMLFNFDYEQAVIMWMKDTYLPLDMIFISRSGQVVGIAADTEPLSEKIIPSGAPAYAVLEVNAGTAAKIDLKIGDLVQNEIFNR
jgi:uncharacterized protein